MSVLSPRAGAGRIDREIWSREGADASLPVPCLRLATEKLLVDVGSGFRADYDEVEAPVLSLAFEYAGVRVSASDPCAQVYTGAEAGYRIFARNAEVEARARYLLESFGAVEIGCVDDCATIPGSEADYLVRVDSDVHAVCSFGAYAVPQLRQLGWRVEVDDGYKWKVIEGEPAWYASVAETDGDKGGGDWFSLELGVELGGQRINLLPALLDLLERSSASSLETLARSWKRCVALPVGENQYLPVPGERLKTLLRVLSELYRSDGAQPLQIDFPAVQAASLVALDEAFPAGVLSWDGDPEIRERSRAIAGGHEREPAEAPPGLRATLRPYQKEGLGFLQFLRSHEVGGILADDMGLGKTLQTISHIVSEKESGRMTGPVLVVAPTSLVSNWQRELERFAPSLQVVVLSGPKRHRRWGQLDGADVAITTYPLVSRDLERYEDRTFYLLILDEAHTIKNARSRAHKAVAALQAEHRLCLTGTPLENNLDELWSLFHFLMPGLLGDAERFRLRYRNPIERDGAEAPLEHLRERVQPFLLRRRKEQVATELPPKTEIVRPVELTGDQRDLYESIRVAAHARVRSAIRQKGIARSTIAILDALMKLRQVCCDPRLVNVESARRVEGSAKFNMLFELLPGLLSQGRRVLLFSQFTSMLALIAQGLTDSGIRYETLTGSTRDRQKPIDRFQAGDSDVFLLSLKAAGTGLNLTSADTVIHYDPWWNPAAQAQATDRAYRIGQKKPVFVYSLIVAGSVEEEMLRLQQKKRELAASILESGAGGFELSDADVEGLFAPLKE